MNIVEFTNRFTGLTRGLLARRQHPNEIEVTVMVEDGNVRLYRCDVDSVVYHQTTLGHELALVVRLNKAKRIVKGN